jgi:anaerobic magnesium-protoporphyrin IX monomethyl ester cyclase
MADVVLINSPMVLNEGSKDYFISEGDEKSNYPMGLLYIAAYLEKNNFSVRVLDVTAAGLTLDNILDIIEKESPCFIGISSMTPGIRSAVVIAQKLRNKFKDSITIGLGGSHVNCDQNFIKRFPLFDLSVIGESEQAVVDIVKKLKQREKVTGIIYAEAINDLDLIPPPARHLININDYFRDEQRLKGKKPVATMLSSRGCPYKCCFCSIPIIKHKVRYRSPKNIVDEMESVYESCDGHYSFVDDALTLNKKNTILLCQEIINRKLKVQWCAMTRANLIDEEVAKFLSLAGCNDLFFGVESGSEKIRNEVIKKQVSNRQITEAIRLCRRYGIHTNIFLMVGFPKETWSDLKETINIGSRVKADLIGIRISIPFPGTGIFNYGQKEGLIPKTITDDYASGKLSQDKKSFKDVWPLFIPKNLTLSDLIKAKKMAYLRFYLNPFWIIRRVKLWIRNRERFIDDLELFRVAPHAFLKGKTKGAMS